MNHQNKKPNIIFILSDQHNADIAGFAGDPYVKTPVLDDLASKGAVFETCYCNSPLCVPSRSSMLTGKLPGKTGVYNNFQALRSEEITVAHSMTVGGYETVLAGRMHFVSYDQNHGFEKRLVGDVTPTFAGNEKQGDIYGMLKGTTGQNYEAVKKSGAGDSAVLHYDRNVCDSACRHIKERDDERPLFMIVGFYGPHCPFVAKKEDYDYYFNTLPACDVQSIEEREKLHPAIRQWIKLRGVEQVTTSELKRVRAAYYGMVSTLDRHVGTILDTVDEFLDRENTLIIYGSDHGESLGNNGLFWKSNFYDTSARVPLIVSWPSHIPSGTRITQPVSLIDLAPSICDFGTAPGIPECDGETLRTILEQGDAPQNTEQAIIGELMDIKGDNPSAMIRLGRYKLIQHCGYEAVQLFDLEADPQEVNDLGSSEQYAGIRMELLSRLSEKWNPDLAMKRLETDKQQVDLMRRWARVVNPSGIGEWKPDTDCNYILAESD